MFQKNKQLEAQRELLERAADRIEELQSRLESGEERAGAWSGSEQFILSQLEGGWEIPVRWAQGPVSLQAVVTTETSPQAPGLEALTVMALQSAFPGRARLEDLRETGWALVRAWPLNSPGLEQYLPGYRADSYILCALTSLSLWQAGGGAEKTSAPQSAHGGFETRI